MNGNMVEVLTSSIPLSTAWQYHIRITPEIHTNIWILGIDHLLMLEPPEEGISERNLRLTSMPRHVIDPPLHAWLGRRRQVEYDVLRLHQWDFRQGKGSQNRTKSKVLQLPVLYLVQLTFHLKKYCITPVEYFRLETLQGVLQMRSVGNM